MRILFCGDIVGRSGRDAVAKHLPEISNKLNIDFIIINAENASHGFGVTKTICE
jgi:calcineurin-like phosphoesterase